MYQARVRFDTVVEAKAFVSICNDMDFKVELIAQPYVIDAKSIMGLSVSTCPNRLSCAHTARRTAANLPRASAPIVRPPLRSRGIMPDQPSTSPREKPRTA